MRRLLWLMLPGVFGLGCLPEMMDAAEERRALVQALANADSFDDFLHVRRNRYVYGEEIITRAEINARQRNWYLSAPEQANLDPLIRKLIQSKKVRIGMTEDQCRASWGIPREINRTTTAYGTSEQWVYSYRSYLYFDDGILTGVQN